MQTITAIKKQLLNTRGSALIGALVASIIIGIAVAGVMSVTGSTVNHEVTALENEKAFYAAESGLLMGTRWLKGVKPWPKTIGDKNGIDTVVINGMNVRIWYEVISIDTCKVLANAANIGLHYSKQLHWLVTPVAKPGGAYGVYLDNAFQFSGNTSGIRKIDLWDGPLHSNTPILLGNPGNGNSNHFNDRVTIYNVNPITNQPFVDNTHLQSGHFGNDYRFGVDHANNQQPDWDNTFQGVYNAGASKLKTDFNSNGKIDLSLKNNDSLLTFGVTGGTPFYTYTNTSGQLQTITYDPETEIKLHINNKGVAVSGVMKGKVSVYTDAGKNIFLPNNLTYVDFNTNTMSSNDIANNSGYGKISQNVIGLYSGADFIVPEGTHYITGQLYAVNNAQSALKFLDDQKNKTSLNIFGTIALSGFWDVKQGNDQASFKQLWDRRQISAPGFGFLEVDGNGSVVYDLSMSKWAEVNIPN